MGKYVEIHDLGNSLEVRTPGRFAMGVAIEVLGFLDGQADFSVKDTGWKNGFGLEVAAWIPIQCESLVAELMTDGESLNIRRHSGSQHEFKHMSKLVRAYLESYDT